MFRVDSDLFSSSSPSLNDAEIANRFRAHHTDDDVDDHAGRISGAAVDDDDDCDDDDGEDEDANRPWYALSEQERFVAHLALKSRCVIGLTSLIATSTVGAYDSSSSLLSPHSPYHAVLLCPSNWDGAFNIRIAFAQQYEYEQAHAFFPLFPLLTGWVRRALWYLTPLWLTPASPFYFDFDDLVFMGLVGAMLNTVFFIAASVVFYRLSVAVFAAPAPPSHQQPEKRRRSQRGGSNRNFAAAAQRSNLKGRQLAMRAATLFCFNPASIFFSVAYTESLFALCALQGMVLLFTTAPSGRRRGRKSGDGDGFGRRMLASACFGLATLTRSNGSMLGLFSVYAAWMAYRREEEEQEPRRRRLVQAKHLVQLVAVGALHASALLVVLGHGWHKYCWGAAEGGGGARRPWCDRAIPNIYSFVQHEYWNLGMFSYYEMKQLPNFLLASPAVAICLAALVSRWRIAKTTGGAVRLTGEAAVATLVPAPFYWQVAVSLCVAATVMHIQVFTRFICSSAPVFFWYSAELTQRQTGSAYFVLLYFAFYMLLGTSMFCAYFPWT